MEIPLDVVFKIHYNGVFMFDPLRYEYGREIVMEASTDSRIMFSPLLDLLVAKIRQNIWALYLCIPELDIDSGGLKIIENDVDVHALYDLAKTHKKVNLYVAHGPQNLAPYYHHNLCLEGSDSEVSSKRKQHDQLKKDAGNMSYEELLAWAEEEAQSPYLRSPPPEKYRPIRKDFAGKVTFTRVWCHEDDFIHDVPFLTEDEVYKSPEKVAENVVVNSVVDDRSVENIPPTEEVVDAVVDNRPARDEVIDVVNDKSPARDEVIDDIDQLVLSRQKKLDKGKAVMTQKQKRSSEKGNNLCRPTGITIRENANPVASDTDSDSEENMNNKHDDSCDYDSYDSGDESDKSYDYLSNCEDEVIELRKRISQRKHSVPDEQDGQQGSDEQDDDMPEVCDSFTYSGLASLVREHERYMESLMKQLKANAEGISDPFSVDLKSKKTEKYPIHDEETHWRLKKPKVILLIFCYYLLPLNNYFNNITLTHSW